MQLRIPGRRRKEGRKRHEGKRRKNSCLRKERRRADRQAWPDGQAGKAGGRASYSTCLHACLRHGREKEKRKGRQ